MNPESGVLDLAGSTREQVEQAVVVRAGRGGGGGSNKGMLQVLSRQPVPAGGEFYGMDHDLGSKEEYR